MTFPAQAARFPALRDMGSKARLLPWIHGALAGLDFETAVDPFSGSGAVSSLMKAMGRSVAASDFLDVPARVAKAIVESSDARADAATLERRLAPNPGADDVIRRTFAGVFFTPGDLAFLDPPYVPRADDDRSVGRTHVVEGLCRYRRGLAILEHTRIRKFAKRDPPFSHRGRAEGAFADLFARFRRQTIVLSYGSNGFPDRDRPVELMRATKFRVEVLARPHRHRFGTHAAVKRGSVEEYRIIGR